MRSVSHFTRNSFDRGYLCAQYLQDSRLPVTAKCLKDYLASHGEHVTLRSCQRYLVRIDRFTPRIAA